MIEVFDCEQNSPEWHRARMGIPTASKFACVMAKGEGKTRRKYMLQLAGEIVTGEPMETYKNDHMERGHIMESEARDLYALLDGTELTRIGFIRNGNKGCSPDSLVGAHGMLEIKSGLPDIVIDELLRDRFPPEHAAQCQGGLWVAEREWLDLTLYCPRVPPYIKRAYRDEDYIRKLAAEVDQFNAELAEVVEKIRRYGTPVEKAA